MPVMVLAPVPVVTGHVTSTICVDAVRPESSPDNGEYSMRGFWTLLYSMRGYSIRGYSIRGVPTASYSIRGYSIRGYSIRGLVTSVTGTTSGLITPVV